MSGTKSSPRFVEVKLDTNCATCVGRNGVFPVGTVCLDEKPDGMVTIGFVSKRLSRRVNAGACIPAGAMDKLSTEWLRMRGLASSSTKPQKEEIKMHAKELADIAHDLYLVAEEL